MFEFKSTPGEVDAPRSLRIVRVPASRKINGVICSERPHCHAVHWFDERTIPHFSKRPCIGCETESPIRVEVFFAAWFLESDQVRILAITDMAAAPVLKYFEKHGSLYMCKFTAWRPSQKKNGRISICCAYGEECADLIPRPIDPKTHLARVWESNLKHVVQDAATIPAGENLDNLSR